MRNTPPIKPIEQRGTSELMEDLCLALRNVGVWDYSLPDDERATAFIKEVKLIYTELEERKVEFQDRIRQLSAETGWQMETLLQECLSYPNVIPYVKESDGVRRAFRCQICSSREVPDREGIWLCDVCLNEAVESIRSRTPSKGLVLFRTYNQSKRCKHADSETVLMTFDDEYDYQMENSYCEQCINDERHRRLEKGTARSSKDV